VLGFGFGFVELTDGKDAGGLWARLCCVFPMVGLD
jgi:hypothetical protein